MNKTKATIRIQTLILVSDRKYLTDALLHKIIVIILLRIFGNAMHEVQI